MRMLKATEERVTRLMPGKAEEVQEAFGAFVTKVETMELPPLPPAIEGQA